MIPTTTAQVAAAALQTFCATTVLPANAILELANGINMTVSDSATMHVACPTIVARDDDDVDVADATASIDIPGFTPEQSREHHYSDFRDPFYSTQIPMVYALAATTVTAYMLVVMLFITQRSFTDGGMVYLGRRGGFTSSSSRGVNIGGRPWLQKVAALTVAISLTVATADTLDVAEQHYKWGIQNAKQLQRDVMSSTDLKAIRLISDTFLWLAQAQTLIRLFPRQREKIIIKWAAFALITLDVIFSALNSFQYSEDGVSGPRPPNSFVHPVPALSYLFQLSLGILYAAWVLYYSLMKKRYAFYHPLMKNISLVAVMAVASVITPVVFFILDISKPDFAGWGDYVRWVGAAAASVVVWEWVERIEALEREEKKDGILGREVFDGDDTLEVNASDFPWFKKSRKPPDDGGEGGGPRASGAAGWPGSGNNQNRGQGHGSGHNPGRQQQMTMSRILPPQIWPARPQPVATPVSRTDTASAASTVYAVRYQPTSEGTGRTPDPLPHASTLELSRQNSIPRSHHTNEDVNASHPPPFSAGQNGHTVPPAPRRDMDLNHTSSQSQNGASSNGWRNLTPETQQTSDRTTDQPGPESQRDFAQEHTYSPARTRNSGSRWAVRARLEEFAANQAERIRERIRPNADTENLPVTVVPAPPRRGAALQQVLEEDEFRDGRHGEGSTSRGSSLELDNVGQTRSGSSLRGPDGLPTNNPPLWPGVRSGFMYDDDDYSYDGDSISDGGSISTGGERDSEEASGGAATSSGEQSSRRT